MLVWYNGIVYENQLNVDVEASQFGYIFYIVSIMDSTVQQG